MENKVSRDVMVLVLYILLSKINLKISHIIRLHETRLLNRQAVTAPVKEDAEIGFIMIGVI